MSPRHPTNARALVKLPAAPRRALARLAPDFQPTAGRPPEVLRGGLINHVWRLRAADGRTVILKHAPPHLATDPAVPLDPARLAFEARALGLFADGAPCAALARDALRPPRLLHFAAAEHCLLLEDVGPGPALAPALAAGQLDPKEAGRALGRFLGGLHRRTLAAPALAREFDNRAIQAGRLRIQYEAVASAACAAGVAPGRAARAGASAVALGRALLGPGRCLVMGDLWPPSLLRTAGGALRLIDWEFAHYGRPAQDLGHFGAHCWMEAHAAATPAIAARFLALWAAFAAAYRTAAGPAWAALMAGDEVRLMNLHAGAEILTRCAGPFVAGSGYAGLGPAHPLMRAAVARAVDLLTRPSTDCLLEIGVGGCRAWR